MAFLAGFGLAFSARGENNLRFMESQDSAATLFYTWWPRIEANKNKIVGIAGGIVALVAIISFYSWHSKQTQIDAGDAVTEQIISLQPGVDPSRAADGYLNVYTEHEGTLAGERALLQGAAILFTEGKYTDAQMDFQRYLDARPDGQFSGQASLGVAKCLEAEGKLNDAAGSYQHIISDIADAQAVVAAKFALAQINVQQKNYADALRLFQDVAQSDPYSATGSEAAQYAYDLRSKVPSTQTAPASPTATAPFQLNH
jgi:TolA-binding protein